jgi:hypothetical protein
MGAVTPMGQGFASEVKGWRVAGWLQGAILVRKLAVPTDKQNELRLLSAMQSIAATGLYIAPGYRLPT